MAHIKQLFKPELYNGLVCGGSVIASTWVLSAAHCTYDQFDDVITAANLTVVLGEHNRSSDKEPLRIPIKTVRVLKYINHPKFIAGRSEDIGYDITLLKLAEHVNMNFYSPVCLPNKLDNFAGRRGWVYFWLF